MFVAGVYQCHVVGVVYVYTLALELCGQRRGGTVVTGHRVTLRGEIAGKGADAYAAYAYYIYRIETFHPYYILLRNSDYHSTIELKITKIE